MIFGNAENKIPHQTTNAHELATAAAFESGLQHFADYAKNCLAQPDYVLDFLSTVPVVWDETKYIEGAPGKWVVMARRKNHERTTYSPTRHHYMGFLLAGTSLAGRRV
ncbi:glycoside hydrolase family 97 C-terminal domain-containing protein [candidate division KSB1 bacterium]|nr:glycoside hydrolase family 97 C-terminal domain-containing protein [candidate division KSB1 bacterium]